MNLETPRHSFMSSGSPRDFDLDSKFSTHSTTPFTPNNLDTVGTLRELVQSSLDNGVYFAARFHADKLVTLTGGMHCDVLLLARSHVAMGDHRQALAVLRKYACFDDTDHKGELNSLVDSAFARSNSGNDSHLFMSGQIRFSPGNTHNSENDFLKRASPFIRQEEDEVGGRGGHHFSFEGEYSFSEEDGSNEVNNAQKNLLFSTNQMSPEEQHNEKDVENQNDSVQEISMEEVITPPENWSCIVCTYLNDPANADCLMCTTPGPSEEERLACTKTYVPKANSTVSTTMHILKKNMPPPSTARKSTPIQNADAATPCRSSPDPYSPFPAPSPCSSGNLGGSGVMKSNNGGGDADELSTQGINNDDSDEESQLYLKLHYLAGQCLHAIGSDDECCSVLTNALGGVVGAEAAAAYAAEYSKKCNVEYQLNNSTTLLDKEEEEEGNEDLMFSPPPRSATDKNMSSANSSVFSSHMKSKLSEIKENKSLDEHQEHERRRGGGEEGARGRKGGVNLRASCCALLGTVLNKKNQTEPAIQWLGNALRIDPYCVEAFDFILTHHCLKSDEEEKLIEALPWITPQDDWLRAFYETKIAPHKKNFVHAGGTLRQVDKSVNDICRDSHHPALHDLLHGVVPAADVEGGNYEVSATEPEPNVELLAAQSEILWCNHEVRAAYELAERAHSLDKLNDAPLLVYLAAMVYLKKKRKLFLLAHEMVEAYPKKWLTWYAVGCYYLSAAKYDKAQQHFLKATKLELKSVAAWIGSGHAFAALDESEQALGMYRSGGRLFVGAHLPMLYMGMEYLKTNNKHLSKSFLTASMNICNDDPLVFNELGVLAFGEGNFQEAELHFIKVLSLYHLDEQNNEPADVHKVNVSAYFASHDEAVESLNFGTILHPACFTALYNLGQTYRKLRKFNQSLKCLKSALSIEPNNGKLHGAIAFTHHLNGHLEEAISGYHIALSFEPQNILFSGLLSRILIEVADIDYLYPNNIPLSHLQPHENNNTNFNHHHPLSDDNSMEMVPPPPPPYCSVAALESEIDFKKQHDSKLQLSQHQQQQDQEIDSSHNETIIYHDQEDNLEGEDESWELSALTSPTMFLKQHPSPNSTETPTTSYITTRSSGLRAQQQTATAAGSSSFMSESDMDSSNIVGEESYDLDSDNGDEDSPQNSSVEMDL